MAEAPNVSKRPTPTYTLTAREYAFWLWGCYFAGLVMGALFGAWIW